MRVSPAGLRLAEAASLAGAKSPVWAGPELASARRGVRRIRTRPAGADAGPVGESGEIAAPLEGISDPYDAAAKLELR